MQTCLVIVYFLFCYFQKTIPIPPYPPTQSVNNKKSHCLVRVKSVHQGLKWCSGRHPRVVVAANQTQPLQSCKPGCLSHINWSFEPDTSCFYPVQMDDIPGFSPHGARPKRRVRPPIRFADYETDIPRLDAR